MKIHNIIIDFEFTWIKNYLVDNDFVSMKVINFDEQENWIEYLFGWQKTSIKAFLKHWIKDSKRIWLREFSKDYFISIIKDNCIDFKEWDKVILYWYWIDMDKSMISKVFDIDEIEFIQDYIDIQDELRISKILDINWDDIEYSMCINWRWLDVALYLVFWYQLSNHNWIYEIELMKKLLWFIKEHKKFFWKKDILTYVPYSFKCWMRIIDFLNETNKSWLSQYLNKNDYFSKTLKYHLNSMNKELKF